MTYKDTMTELYNLQQYAIKLGLHNISFLLQRYKNPHLSYPVIHIAGTNGKGSTAAIIQKILMNYGFRTGLYTSPHLVDFRERIRIDDDLITKTYIEIFWKDIKSEVYKKKATFFDTTTCLAFKYFKDEKIDIAIIETGLGGRLDSTNVVKPEAAVITAIGYDHQKQLGDNIELIAGEKAGIIKKGAALFIGKQQNTINKYFTKYKRIVEEYVDFEHAVKLLQYDSDLERMVFSFYDVAREQTLSQIILKLAGLHQVENAILAYLVTRWYLEKKNMEFDQQKYCSAFKEVNWPGRFQKTHDNPTIILDVSHNTDGFKRTLEIMTSMPEYKRKKILIGLLEDKKGKEIIKEINHNFDEVIVTEPNHYRKMAGEKMIIEFKNNGIEAKLIKDSKKAYETAVQELSPQDFLLITGSHYLIGEYMQYNISQT